MYEIVSKKYSNIKYYFGFQIKHRLVPSKNVEKHGTVYDAISSSCYKRHTHETVKENVIGVAMRTSEGKDKTVANRGFRIPLEGFKECSSSSKDFNAI